MSFPSRVFCFSLLAFVANLFSTGCTERARVDLAEPEPPNPSVFTEIRGNISGTLDLGRSPYLAKDSLVARSRAVLQIEPGVRLHFEPGTQLIVHGQLLANGRKERPIAFTASELGWLGIHIEGSSATSEIKFAIVEKVSAQTAEVRGSGAIEVNQAGLRASNTLFRHNDAIQGGGLVASNANVEITNCVFYRNEATSFGGGLLLENSTGSVINCTFVLNSSSNYGGGIAILNSTALIQNNVFHRNTSRVSDPRISINGGQVDSSYNFVDLPGQPAFVSEADANFHLLLGSPCINAGDPAPEWNDVDGSRNDQGAYGGPAGDW